MPFASLCIFLGSSVVVVVAVVVVVVVVVVEGVVEVVVEGVVVVVVVAVEVVITYRSLVESGSPWLGPGVIYFMSNPLLKLVPFVWIPCQGQGQSTSPVIYFSRECRLHSFVYSCVVIW